MVKNDFEVLVKEKGLGRSVNFITTLCSPCIGRGIRYEHAGKQALGLRV